MLRRLLLLAVLLLAVPGAYAQTCSSIASGNWNAAGTWSCTGVPGGIPVAGTAVTIVNANPPHTVTVTANAAAASVTLATGTRQGTLALNAGVVLTVSGAVTMNAPTNNTRPKLITLAANSQLLVGTNLTINNNATAGFTSEL